jgi:hypothetical protein
MATGDFAGFDLLELVLKSRASNSSAIIVTAGLKANAAVDVAHQQDRR